MPDFVVASSGKYPWVSSFLCMCRHATYATAYIFLAEIQIIKVPCLIKKKKGKITKTWHSQKIQIWLTAGVSIVVLSVYKIVLSCLLQVWIFCLSNCFNLNIFSFILYSFRSVFSYVYTHKHVYSKCVYEHMFQ